jgi:hypothetical protein
MATCCVPERQQSDVVSNTIMTSACSECDIKYEAINKALPSGACVCELSTLAYYCRGDGVNGILRGAILMAINCDEKKEKNEEREARACCRNEAMRKLPSKNHKFEPINFTSFFYLSPNSISLESPPIFA